MRQKTILMVFLIAGLWGLPGHTFAAGANGSVNNAGLGCNPACAVGNAVRIHTPRGHPQLDKPPAIAPLSSAQPGIGGQISLRQSSGFVARQSVAIAAGGTALLGGMVMVMPELLAVPHTVEITVVK